MPKTDKTLSEKIVFILDYENKTSVENRKTEVIKEKVNSLYDHLVNKEEREASRVLEIEQKRALNEKIKSLTPEQREKLLSDLAGVVEG